VEGAPRTSRTLDSVAAKIGDNVRDAVHLGKEFLTSLREHGVLVPITAVRDDDGHVVVRHGQRRTLGAREVGLRSVYVLQANTSDGAAEAIERIAEQIVTNDQKAELTEAQRARGIQQMIQAGLTVTKVAKKLSVGKDVVKAAETAAKYSAALEALAGGQISLSEAAVLTESMETTTRSPNWSTWRALIGSHTSPPGCARTANASKPRWQQRSPTPSAGSRCCWSSPAGEASNTSRWIGSGPSTGAKPASNTSPTRLTGRWCPTRRTSTSMHKAR